MLQYTCEVV